MTDTNPLLSAFTAAAGTPEPAADTTVASTDTAQIQDTPDSGDSSSSPFDFFLNQTKQPAANEVQDTPEPTPEAAADTEDFPETITGAPEAQAKWGELRKELKEARARVAEFEAENGTPDTKQQIQAAAALEKQVREYEAKMQEYERELSISRVEATREYKALVEEPLNAIVNSAEKVAAAYNVDANELINALTETDPKRQTQMLDELVEGMSERDRARIYRMADDTAAIYETDAGIRARAAEALSEVEAQQQAEAQYYAEQRAAENFEATTRVWDMVTERLPDIGVDYAALKNDVFASDFDAATPEARSYAASASVVLPHLVKAMAEKDARISELERALGGMRKATPSSPAGNAASPQRSQNPIAGMLFEG
jgi:hypothetical protein